MFVHIRIALLSRAVALVIVLVIELRLILADSTGSGDFTLLDPKIVLLGVACYLALGSQRILPPLQDGKDAHSA
ncbi:MAG: hypothetical protein ACRDS9_19945 [Pseudonocardiaceae bacterium]